MVAIVFLGLFLPIMILPLFVYVATLLMPPARDAASQAWEPLVRIAIALSYSVALAPLVVLANVHLVFRRKCTMRMTLRMGMIPPLAILIVGSILFRYLPGPMEHGADVIWTALWNAVQM